MSYAAEWKPFTDFVYISKDVTIESFNVRAAQKAFNYDYFIGEITYVLDGVTYKDPDYTIYAYDPCYNTMVRFYRYIYEDILEVVNNIPDDRHVTGINNIETMWLGHISNTPVVVAKVGLALDSDYYINTYTTSCIVLTFPTDFPQTNPGSTIYVFESLTEEYYIEYKVSGEDTKTTIEAASPKRLGQYNFPVVAFYKDVHFNHPGVGRKAVIGPLFGATQITEVIHDNLRITTLKIGLTSYSVESLSEEISWYYQGFDDTWVWYGGGGKAVISGDIGLIQQSRYEYFHPFDVLEKPTDYWNWKHNIQLRLIWPSDITVQKFEVFGNWFQKFTCSTNDLVLYINSVVCNDSNWEITACTYDEYLNEDDGVSPWHSNCDTFQRYSPVYDYEFIGQAFAVDNFVCPIQLLYCSDFPSPGTTGWQTFWSVGSLSSWCGWVAPFEYPLGAIPGYAWYESESNTIYVRFSNNSIYYLRLPSTPVHSAPTSLTHGAEAIFVGGGVGLPVVSGTVTYSGGHLIIDVNPPFYSALAAMLYLPEEYPVSGHVDVEQNLAIIGAGEFSLVKLLDSSNVLLHGDMGRYRAMIYGTDYLFPSDISYNLPSGYRGRSVDFNLVYDTATIALLSEDATETYVYTASVDEIYPSVDSGELGVFSDKAPWSYLSHAEGRTTTAIRFEDDDAYFIGQTDTPSIRGWVTGNTWDERNGSLPANVWITDIEEARYSDR